MNTDRGEITPHEVSSNDQTENGGVGDADDGSGKNCCKKRTKIIISILEKINMIFLIFFVCYLSWTIPANYGLFMSNKASSNSSIQDNASRKLQNEEMNSTEQRLNTALINFSGLSKSSQRKFQNPNGRKQSSRKRKKQGSRRQKLNFSSINGNEIESSNQDKSYQNRFYKQHPNCFDCTKRKKSRRKKKKNRRLFGDKLKPTTIRHIIEQVAREALIRGSGNSWDHENDIFTDNFGDDTSSDNKGSNNIDDGSNLPSTNTDGNERAWGSWGPCSVTCGAGQQERTRSCGSTCKEVESMVCFAPKCEDGAQNSVVDFYLWEKEGFIPTPQTKEFLDPDVDACGNWMKCNKDGVVKYLEKADLPSCPCKFPIHLDYNDKVWDKQKKQHFSWKDASKKEDGLYAYKPGALHCIRSKLYHGTPTLAAQHCCYDSDLKLITRGKGAGTPNLISPEMSPELHQKVDLDPWIICKGDWTRYNQIINPDNGLSCPENPDDKEFRRQAKEAKNY